MIMNLAVSDFLDNFLKKCAEYKKETYGDNDPESVNFDPYFLAAILYQNIESCDELVEDLETYRHEIRIYENNEAYDPVVATALIRFYEFSSEQISHYYKIEFSEKCSQHGSCICSPEDPGYNPQYGCCGTSCEWTLPEIFITQITDMGHYSWNGSQKDYWEACEEIESKYGNWMAIQANEERKRLLDEALKNADFWNSRVQELKLCQS